MLERYAELDGQIGVIEATRREDIAAANRRCDTAIADLAAERDEIRDKLAPWWAKAAVVLTKGKRKSIELGGCMLGTRTARAVLAITGREEDVVDHLKGLRWAKPLLKVKTTLDRVATLGVLDGRHKVVLAELGLAKGGGEEVFYVERVNQGGTMA